jgi:hypothetical protein
MKRRAWELLGYITTLLLGAAALAPQSFHVPNNVHPWVFLAAVIWFFLCITGFFR